MQKFADTIAIKKNLVLEQDADTATAYIIVEEGVTVGTVTILPAPAQGYFIYNLVFSVQTEFIDTAYRHDHVIQKCLQHLSEKLFAWNGTRHVYAHIPKQDELEISDILVEQGFSLERDDADDAEVILKKTNTSHDRLFNTEQAS